jgi:hypothetical protein
MHSLPLRLLIGAVLVAPAWAARPVESPEPARAEVVFLEPKGFTDVRDEYLGEASRTTYLEQLREHVLERSRRYVAEGQFLSITVTDVDMAGDFEPWLGPRWMDVRIVKDIYPPRIDLTFRLTDASGRVVAEGRRQLRDLAFLMKLSMGFRDDPLRHEKALLDDWLQAEFPVRPRS